MTKNSLVASHFLVLISAVLLLGLTSCHRTANNESILAQHWPLSPLACTFQEQLYYVDTQTHQLMCYNGVQSFSCLPLDTFLETPTAITLTDSFLFVAGKQCIEAIELTPQPKELGLLLLPKADSLISDMQVVGRLLLVASQSGHAIRAIDVQHSHNFAQQKAYLYCHIQAPVALACTDSALYVLSMSTDSLTWGNKKLQIIAPLQAPKARTLLQVEHDVIALAYDAAQKQLYMTNAAATSLSAWNMKPNSSYQQLPLLLPADPVQRYKLLFDKYVN